MNKRIRKKKDREKVLWLVSHLKEGQAVILTSGSFLKVDIRTLTVPLSTSHLQPIEIDGYLSEVIKK